MGRRSRVVTEKIHQAIAIRVFPLTADGGVGPSGGREVLRSPSIVGKRGGEEVVRGPPLGRVDRSLDGVQGFLVRSVVQDRGEMEHIEITDTVPKSDDHCPRAAPGAVGHDDGVAETVLRVSNRRQNERRLGRSGEDQGAPPLEEGGGGLLSSSPGRFAARGGVPH